MTKILVAFVLGILIATAGSTVATAGIGYTDRFTLLKELSNLSLMNTTANVIQDKADGRCFLIVFSGHEGVAIGPAVPCAH